MVWKLCNQISNGIPTMYISPLHNSVKNHEIIVKTFTRQLDVTGMFPARQPLWIEIGFGVGKFFLSLAQAHPDINFMGIEYNLSRYYKMLDKLSVRDLHNVRLTNTDAVMSIRYLIPDQSIDRVFINFPDPWPKTKHEKNRLFSLYFIRDLARCVKPDALVRVQTDVESYANHIRDYMVLENLFETVDRFEPDIPLPATTFQDRFIGLNIPYYTMVFKRI